MQNVGVLDLQVHLPDGGVQLDTLSEKLPLYTHLSLKVPTFGYKDTQARTLKGQKPNDGQCLFCRHSRSIPSCHSETQPLAA